jgi:multisubunit Na+/H+ antiporter MnhB subunit
MPVIFTEVIPQYAQAGLVAWFVAPIGLALLGFILGGRVDGPITDYVLTHKHPLGFTAHQPLSNALNKPRHRQ